MNVVLRFLFHLRWSSLLSGRGERFASSCLMLCLSILLPFMFWMCCCTVEAMCSRCQPACLALLVVYSVWLMRYWWLCCIVAHRGEFSQSAVINMAAAALCSKDLTSMGAPTPLNYCKSSMLHQLLGRPQMISVPCSPPVVWRLVGAPVVR